MEGEARVGVYICHCGMNIAGVVDVEEVAKYVGDLPGVATAKHYVYICSQPGQALIKEDIKKLNLNRVVVASCSPRMHEPTFRKVLEEAGLNPFLFEMANIREHVSWAHMRMVEKATGKAKDLIRMAVARAKLLEPVSRVEVGVVGRGLVVGAGVAGLTAALDLADRGFEVYLVEREPYIGGHLALLNKLYWGSDASNLLASLIQRLSHTNLKVLVNSDVVEVGGYVGNFKVKIVQRPRYVDERCNLCGRCEEVCPVSILNPLNLGLDGRKAIYLPLPNSYPARYVIDKEACNNCGKCLKACSVGAINLNDKPVEISLDIGTIIASTGFEPYKPNGEFGYRIHKDVITQLALERILSRYGPTKGALLKPSDGKEPSSVAFILCVGSRQEAASNRRGRQVNTYCSRFCCSSALKNASIIKEQYPEIDVYVIYRDIRTFGRGHENLYRRCRELGVNFIRYGAKEPPNVEGVEGKLIVKVKDRLFNVMMEVFADLVVLVEGVAPRKDVVELQSKLNITRTPDGFFQEAHPKMNPLNTFSDGIFIAGACQGPKDVEDAVTQASGAAAKASIYLSQGKILLDLATAIVDEKACSGCGKCIDICPYKAISLEEVKGSAMVVEAKCKACGSCSSTCPTGAMQIRHYKDDQVMAMIEALTPAG